MAPKAGPASRTGSSSRLASAAPSASLSTATPATTPDPVVEEASTLLRLYSFFYRGGTAYTYNGYTARRYYCKACLEHEIQVVKAARERFSQAAPASPDVLRDIALGRIEYFVPNRNIFREHLETYCTHLTAEARSDLKEICKLLSEEKKPPYQNQYDYGSLYEAVQYPKFADSKQDIQPGSASPAHIFAAHEATLLERAQKRRRNEVYNRYLKERKAQTEDRETTETYMSETPAFDLDDFEEAQRLEDHNQSRWKEEVRLDTSNMYDIDADTASTDREVLSDFPSSDLLKALQTHAGDLYAKRGLMSTETKPKNANGEKLPSMIQAFDGSALIALGVLAEELTRAQVIRPYHPQPITDFYERKVDKRKMRGLYGYGKKQDNEVINRILKNLPEGSVVGLASGEANSATLQLDDSDTEMDEENDE